MSTDGEARIYAMMGASGSGKSARTKLEIAERKPPRLMIWDPKREYSPMGLDAFDSLSELGRAAFKRKRFALAFHPKRTKSEMRDQFSTFCKIADAAGDLTAVCEELSDVTLPGWAPDGWSMLTRQGRHSRMTLYGNSQSPAAIDKTFWGNTTRICTGVLGTASDVKTLADVLMIDKADIFRLLPMQFINLDKGTREVTRGLTDKNKIAELKRLR